MEVSPLLLPKMISEAPAKLVCVIVMTKKRRKMVLLLLCMERSPTSASMVIKGFGGSRTTNVKSGTLRWKWEDDLGATNTFRIPNSHSRWACPTTEPAKLGANPRTKSPISHKTWGDNKWAGLCSALEWRSKSSHNRIRKARQCGNIHPCVRLSTVPVVLR